MHIEIKVPKIIVAKYIECILPVNYDHDKELLKSSIPGDLFDGKILKLTLDIDNEKVLFWKQENDFELYIKVVDGGEYNLLNENGLTLASKNDCYVPECIPNKYGDYVWLKISDSGKITNWNILGSQIVDSFFNENA